MLIIFTNSLTVSVFVNRDQKSRLKLAHEIISASLIMHQNIGDICCLGNHVTLAGFLKFTVSRFAILQEAKLFFSPPEIV